MRLDIRLPIGLLFLKRLFIGGPTADATKG